MLGKFVNMAELSRQMGLGDALQGEAGGSLKKVGQGGLAGSKLSGGGGKGGRSGGNDRAETLSELPLCGVRLDQRGELVRLAQPLLDQGVSVAEVQAALVEFVKCNQWTPLSAMTLEGIVESAFDALLDVELQEDAAQRELKLAPQADELAEVSLAGMTPQPVRWLWPGKIPLDKVTVIDSEAGIGKICLALDLAARVRGTTSGRRSARGSRAAGCSTGQI